MNQFCPLLSVRQTKDCTSEIIKEIFTIISTVPIITPRWRNINHLITVLYKASVPLTKTLYVVDIKRFKSLIKYTASV